MSPFCWVPGFISLLLLFIPDFALHIVHVDTLDIRLGCVNLKTLLFSIFFLAEDHVLHHIPPLPPHLFSPMTFHLIHSLILPAMLRQDDDI